jgi:hypothetical protein
LMVKQAEEQVTNNGNFPFLYKQIDTIMQKNGYVKK